MAELEAIGGPRHIEYDEYSVIFEADYILGGGPAQALPGHDPESAYEAFKRQFASVYSRQRELPKVLGMQKLHLVKDYGQPELFDWTPPGTERTGSGT